MDYVLTLLPLIRNASFTENVFMKVSSKNPEKRTLIIIKVLNLWEYAISVDSLTKLKHHIMVTCVEIITKMTQLHVVFVGKCNFSEILLQF